MDSTEAFDRTLAALRAPTEEKAAKMMRESMDGGLGEALMHAQLPAARIGTGSIQPAKLAENSLPGWAYEDL